MAARDARGRAVRSGTTRRAGLLLALCLLAGCREDRPVQATGGWRVVDSPGTLTRSETLCLERESLDALVVGATTWRPTLRIDARPAGTLRLPVGTRLLGSAPFARAPVQLVVDGRHPVPVQADVLSTWTEMPRNTVDLMRGGQVAVFVLQPRDGAPPIRLGFDLRGLGPSLEALQAEAAARDAAATPAGMLRGMF